MSLDNFFTDINMINTCHSHDTLYDNYKEKIKNTWKINVFNMNMMHVLKKKIKYFYNPYNKILSNLSSLNYSNL